MSSTTRHTAQQGLTALRALAVLVELAVSGALAFWLLRPAATPLPPLAPVTIAVPQMINSAPMLVAVQQGLFKETGVNVVSQPFVIGRDALQSVLDGKADLALVADTPVMFATLAGADVSILASRSIKPICWRWKTKPVGPLRKAWSNPARCPIT